MSSCKPTNHRNVMFLLDGERYDLISFCCRESPELYIGVVSDACVFCCRFVYVCLDCVVFVALTSCDVISASNSDGPVCLFTLICVSEMRTNCRNN